MPYEHHRQPKLEPAEVAHQAGNGRLIERLIELPVNQWRPFLEDGASDLGLAREAESLQQGEVKAGKLIKSPLASPEMTSWERPGAPPPSASPDMPDLGEGDARPSRRLGPFRILEELGRGGMGTVYLAEQNEPIERQLAVKVVRTDLTAEPVRERFAAERQALARLSHQYIAQIYEAGATEEGFPYFAMELVSGEPITVYCDRRRLSLEKRLSLFVKVCQGVQHAHQRGIIHRDLKPSNIMISEVEGQPIPKLIDFGIAKALDRPLTDVTQLTPGPVGTPAYMSPESMGLAGEPIDLDTRSDIYSLGVVLYELLAGVRPFEVAGTSIAETLKRMTSEEAPRLSIRVANLDEVERSAIADKRGLQARHLARRLSGDLDWIAAKAILKERDQRYRSAAALAEDIGRYLRHEAVLAHPARVSYRACRFIRRHRAGVAAAMVAAAALMVGMVQARHEAENARLALEETQEMSRFLTGLFTVSDPRTARGDTITVREILDRGAEDIRTRFTDQPETRARFMRTIGNIYMQLGMYDRAAPLLEEELEVRTSLAEGDLLELAVSLRGVGALCYHQGRYQDAKGYFERAIQIQERILGPESHELAVTANNLAAIFFEEGDVEQAEALYTRALKILEQELGSHHPDIAKILNGLARLYQNRGDYGQAEQLFRRSLEIREMELGKDHPYVAFTLVNLGDLCRRLNRNAEAESLFLRALAIREKTLGPDHPDIATSVRNLAILYLKQERYAEAEPLYQRALEITEKALGQNHPEVAKILNSIGVFYFFARDYDAAEEALGRALEIRLSQLGPEHPYTLNTSSNLGLVFWKQGRLAEAERNLSRALEAKEQRFGADHPTLGFALWGLAGVYRDQGRFDDAEPLYERCITIWRRSRPEGDRDLETARADYAILLRAIGRDGEVVSIGG